MQSAKHISRDFWCVDVDDHWLLAHCLLIYHFLLRASVPYKYLERGS